MSDNANPWTTLNEIVFLCGSTPNVSRTPKGHSGAGWYAHNSEYPDEGAQFLGREPDDIARLLETAIAEINRIDGIAATFDELGSGYLARAEKAEKELVDVHDALHRECDGTANLPDEIRALRSDRDAALARRDEVISDLDRIQGQVGPELARLRALVAELAKALEGVIDPAEDVCAELRCLSDGCEEYVTALYASITTARGAMAKAKGVAL